MSREIKFRVWSNHDKCWRTSMPLYDYCCESYFLNAIFGQPNDNGWNAPIHYQKDDLVFEQFTGLKDTNGKDVYEGDIVTYVEGIELGDKTLETAIVVYCDTLAAFGYAPKIDHDCWNYIWEGTVSKPTIIGNIHENPNLIT